MSHRVKLKGVRKNRGKSKKKKRPAISKASTSAS